MREAFDGTPAFVGGKRGKPCLHISILRDIARIFSAFLMTRKQLLQCYCLGDFKRNLIPFLFFVLGMALPVPSKKETMCIMDLKIKLKLFLFLLRIGLLHIYFIRMKR